MSEKLCLKWNDFQENVNTAFGSLRHNTEFSDVTLACEDGQQFEVHKVILASSSPTLHHLLKANQHPHPLIYMRGMKSEDLNAIIDFLYCGEANVFQENLDSFLAIAEELKLKGLMGNTEEAKPEKLPSVNMNPTAGVARKDQNEQNTFKSVHKDQQLSNISNKDEQIVENPKHYSGNLSLEELDVQVKSMMEKSQNMIQIGSDRERRRAEICKVCGKEGHPQAIRDHIEFHHLHGVSLPCNICEKTFRSRNNLRSHSCRNKSLI